MLGDVETRSVSPVFVGREGEFASLVDALARACAEGTDVPGEPQALLIGGEAGVGKTRLVEEFLAAAVRRGAAVAVGGCVEIGADGLPYAPFPTALRALRRTLPDEVAAACAGQEGELARLLPELGEADRDATDEHSTARLFELTARLLERISADRIVVLVLEDLHWADASTRHLLAYLFRTVRHGRLVVIGTYRSDDIHRRHPLRPLLAELDRLRTVRRIELARFSRAEVCRQLTGILAATPEAALVDEIFERSDGNAFFVEELACSLESGDRSRLSDSLRDLLLVRVEALPDAAQQVARAVAEGGSTVEYGLLAAVAGLTEDGLIEALRAAVGANLLLTTPEGNGYRFRHSLVREAVSDDLLPGERSRLNRRYAEALEADPALVRADERATRLASYWYGAHDAAKALPAVLKASVEARRRYAFSEQLRLLERAMELWDDAPDDVRRTLRPMDYAEGYPVCGCDPDTAPLRCLDLMAEATVAARFGGERERALAIAKKAMRVLADEDDPLRAAWFWVQRSRLMQDLGRGDGRAELATAQELVRGLPPSAVHADVLTSVAGWGALHRPGAETLLDADRAVEYARLVGDEYIELHARLIRGRLTAEAGGVDEGIAEMYAVRERADELHLAGIMSRAGIDLPSTLESMGRSLEAVAAADHGIEISRSRGIADMEARVRCNRATSLFSLGHWDESRATTDAAARAARSGKARGLVALHRTELALARGDLTEAEAQLALTRRSFGSRDPQLQHVIAPARHAMALAAQQGRLAEARAEFEARSEQGFPPGTQQYALPLLHVAAATEADARGLPTADPGRPAILARIRAHLKGLPMLVPVWAAHGLLIDAELARAEGLDTPDHWSRAAAAFAPLHRPYELARIRHRWAEALLVTAGDRSTVTTLLREAHRTVVRLGARPLTETVELLAGRARIALGAPDGGTAPEIPAAVTVPAEDGAGDGGADRERTGDRLREAAAAAVESFGLTRREQDVHRLVAAGHTNRRIAEELYISPKTASVHVSSILAKLGVTTRGEAAALAHRLRLYPARNDS
ncbi:helix-turn-helix transcriptional regulator [Streptomyces gelaticus]|uniref:Helix-turn-helix transcriptional regulator n=1 Tax=Streptomyces gelaticus TaxID=285446 RepID=A0ABQ2W8H5_9ACTN|nr:AAA family ATPase [Streptomyces gelaticus]GGV95614.1 helix-turn-helix transcriptional regulator [Streptomyces gelaticus]